jgi:hypothetical protein
MRAHSLAVWHSDCGNRDPVVCTEAQITPGLESADACCAGAAPPFGVSQPASRHALAPNASPTYKMRMSNPLGYPQPRSVYLVAANPPHEKVAAPSVRA